MGNAVPWLYMLVVALLPGRWGESNDEPGPNDAGQLGTAAIVAVLVGVLVLIITVFLLSGVADPYFNATENITNAVQNASTGNSTIDQLLEPFGILVAGVLVLAFITKITDQV